MLDPPHRTFPKPLVQFRPASSPPTSPTSPQSKRWYTTDPADNIGARDDGDVSPPPQTMAEQEQKRRSLAGPPVSTTNTTEIDSNQPKRNEADNDDEGINEEQRARFEKIQKSFRDNNKSNDDDEG